MSFPTFDEFLERLSPDEQEDCVRARGAFDERYIMYQVMGDKLLKSTQDGTVGLALAASEVRFIARLLQAVRFTDVNSYVDHTGGDCNG